MDAMDELYQKVAAGSHSEVELRARIGAIKKRVREARAGTAEERTVALTVASAMPTEARAEMLGFYLSDELPDIRARALNLAVELKGEGLRVLRAACLIPHADVAVPALALITRGVDKTSTGRIMRLLSSGNPKIRAAAARFLGHAGGPAVIPRLTRLLADPYREVSYAAEVGIERLRGERTKRPPMNWWDAPELEDEQPEEDEEENEVVELDTADLPPPPPIDGLGDLGGLGSLAALAPPKPAGATQRPRRPAPRHQRTAAPSPAPQPLTRRPPLDWEPEDAALLPTPLPTEAYALAKLLSLVSASDRASLLGPLSADSEARAAIDRLARSQAIPERTAAALAIGGLKMGARLPLLTRMFRDADPRVRSAAAAAMAPLAGASALAQLSRLFSDSSPAVRRAAALALAKAASRIDHVGFAQNALSRLDADPDDGVAEARETARQILGG
ncbi:MAG: HEAT repeat domain-containing protein [Proteobacteria bacterium]|nr:HEAT repeat domain-containing protein [Pseudomonadota bacterium]